METPSKREYLFPAERCSRSTARRDKAKIFGKLTDAALGIKCLHLLQIGPRCFASAMWMATAAAEKHHPWASRNAPLCSQPPRPCKQGQQRALEQERSKGGCRAPWELQGEDLTPSVPQRLQDCLHAPMRSPAAHARSSSAAVAALARRRAHNRVIRAGLLRFSSPLPNGLSAAPARQTDPGLGPPCSYKTSFHSIISIKLNFQLHLIQN